MQLLTPSVMFKIEVFSIAKKQTRVIRLIFNLQYNRQMRAILPVKHIHEVLKSR